MVNVPDVVVHGQYSLPTAETMGDATALGISATKIRWSQQGCDSINILLLCIGKTTT